MPFFLDLSKRRLVIFNLFFYISSDYRLCSHCKINSNLEEQAKALFKSWFIDFEPFKDGKFVDSELGKIPEGWKVLSLDNIAV